jgi:hypothetical protein
VPFSEAQMAALRALPKQVFVNAALPIVAIDGEVWSVESRLQHTDGNSYRRRWAVCKSAGIYDAWYDNEEEATQALLINVGAADDPVDRGGDDEAWLADDDLDGATAWDENRRDVGVM